jgi:general secretion pathway protein K
VSRAIKQNSRNERGMALLVVIVVISLLIILTVQLGSNMRRELVSSANLKDDQGADNIARSGVNIAMEILVADRKISDVDSFHDAWGQVSSQDLSSLFEQGVLHLTVADLSGRLQVNSLVSVPNGQEGVNAFTAAKMRAILKRLLLSGNFGELDERKAAEIVDSLADWIDSDDRTSDFGAEENYYRSLEHPYGCKNGPVTFIEELLLVKGITSELLYGDSEHKGLAGFLTAQGNDGKININTADPVLLQAMASGVTEELAKTMVDFRDEENNERKLSSINWYKDVPGWPQKVVFDEKSITTKSSFFMISAIGEVSSIKKTHRAIVHRELNNLITLLSRKVE